MSLKRVHVIGAGVAGLAASIRLSNAGLEVVLHEAAPQAGGRCRSYFDETIGSRIDNGNHLVIAGNTAVMSYLSEIDALDTIGGPPEARFDFVDLKSGERWAVRPNPGRLPWWIFRENRRVPRTSPWDYLQGLRLARARPDHTVTALLDQNTLLFQRLWEPLAVSALNTDLAEASALSLARVLRETFGRGGAACRPLAPNEGLSESLVEPALDRLRTNGAQIRLGSRLRTIEFENRRASKLVLDQGDEPLDVETATVLAVPPTVATRVVPGLAAPDAFRPIVNAHFRVNAPADTPLFIGVIGGATQWVFRKREVLSVTISAANGLVDRPAQELAELIWPEVQRAYDLPGGPLPPWQIVKEKRATFAATPAQLSRRPNAVTRWENLVLAGDWIETGLPATIEGAIRSGFTAANVLLGGKRTSLMNDHNA